jgi:hypothetical protein
MCVICLLIGSYIERKKHKYAGRLVVTRDKDDGQIYLTADLSELNSLEELYSYDTVTLKIQLL